MLTKAAKRQNQIGRIFFKRTLEYPEVTRNIKYQGGYKEY